MGRPRQLQAPQPRSRAAYNLLASTLPLPNARRTAKVEVCQPRKMPRRKAGLRGRKIQAKRGDPLDSSVTGLCDSLMKAWPARASLTLRQLLMNAAIAA